MNFTYDIDCEYAQYVIDRANIYFPELESYILLAFGILIVFGVSANLCVIAAVIKDRRLRRSLNVSIAHLAASDLCFCFFTAPSTLYLYARAYWPFGDMACKTVASAQALNTFVSSFTLAAIALCRYITLSDVKFRRSVLVTTLVAVWMVSLALSAPYFFVVGVSAGQSVKNVSNSSLNQMINYRRQVMKQCNIVEPMYCVEFLDENPWLSSKLYTIVVFALQYACPLTALITTYFSIGTKLKNRFISQSNRVALSSSIDQKKKKLKWSLLLLSSLVACYALCWMPTNLYHILVNEGYVMWRPLVKLCTFYIGMLQVAINPILYGLFNRNFRRVYVRMFYDVTPCLNAFRGEYNSRTGMNKAKTATNNAALNQTHFNTRANGFHVQFNTPLRTSSFVRSDNQNPLIIKPVPREPTLSDCSSGLSDSNHITRHRVVNNRPQITKPQPLMMTRSLCVPPRPNTGCDANIIDNTHDVISIGIAKGVK